jgi:CBS domain-containing protein
VPVIDGQGTLRGIITEADFAEKERGVPFSAYRAPQLFGRWVSQRDVEAIYAAARSLPARAIMSTPVLTVTEDTPVKEILDLMLRHDVTHLPVVREGAPVGMVSRHDLLRLVARAAGEETAGATGG